MVDPDSQRQQPGSRTQRSRRCRGCGSPSGSRSFIRSSQQPLVRALGKALQHFPHGGEHRPPQADLEWIVDPHPDEEHNDLVAEVAYIGGVATLENLSRSEPPLAAKFDDSPVFARRLWLNDLLPFRDPFRTTEKRYFEPRTIGGEGSRPICGRRREGAGNGDSRVKVSDSVSFGPHCGYISAGRECARRDSNP